ncbi:hypothetical protein C806_00061 [Lachnospiraceae bacterium 3-1]|nr:hypothetical protein C806_00061 [Lachnospiraceae bacterium 3-1]
MNTSEKMLAIMQRMGRIENKELKRAEMLNPSQCKIGNLILDREDYLKPEGMEFEEGDTVIIYRLDETKYVIIAKVV